VGSASRRKFLDLELGFGFAEDGNAIAEDDKFADSPRHQMEALRGLGSRQDGFDPFQTPKDFRRGVGVFGRAKPDITRPAERAM